LVAASAMARSSCHFYTLASVQQTSAHDIDMGQI
jgi:hypothetical protein